MRLLRIEAKNYRQFPNLEIFFPESGFIGITGDNGTGKSSILNILDFTFFGKYKEIKQKQQIKTFGAPKNAPTYTIVDFVYNDHYYRIRRDLSTSPDKTYVRKNGETVATGTSYVNDYIRNNLLKMDQDTFRACFYAAQDEFDSLVKVNDAPRIRMFSRFFRIDSIDVAAEQARKDKRTLEIQLDELKRHIKDENVVAKEIKTLEEQIKESEKSLSSIQKQVEHSEKQRNEIKQTYDKSMKTYEMYRSILADLTNIQTKKETLSENALHSAKQEYTELKQKKERLEKIKKSKQLYFDLIQRKDKMNEQKEQYLALANIQKQIKQIQESMEYYQQSLEDSNKQLQALRPIEQQANELEQNIQSKEEQISKLRDKTQELLTLLKVKKEEYEQKQQELENFKQLGTDAPCPTCKQPLGQEHFEEELKHLHDSLSITTEEIKKNKRQYEEVSQSGLQLKEEIDSLKQHLKNLQLQLNTKSGFTTQKENAERELQRLKQQLQQLNKERSQLPEKVDFDQDAYQKLMQHIQKITPLYEEVIQLEKTVEKIPQVLNNIEHLKQTISQLEETYQAKEKELQSLAFDQEHHENLQKELEFIQSQFEEMQQKRYSLQSNIQVEKNQLTTLQNDLKEINKKKKEMKDKEEEIILLTKLDQLFKTYKTDKLAKIAPTLSDVMSDMVDFLTDGRYDRVELDSDYKIHVYRNGSLKPFEIFSGGEKKLFALCLRLAISQLLTSQTKQNSFDLIALDEVFGNFTEKRQDALIDMFRNLTEMFNQILVVSHNEYVKNLYDHILHVTFDERTFTSTVEWQRNDLGQPTFDEEYIEQLVYENFDLHDIETA